MRIRKRRAWHWGGCREVGEGGHSKWKKTREDHWMGGSVFRGSYKAELTWLTRQTRVRGGLINDVWRSWFSHFMFLVSFHCCYPSFLWLTKTIPTIWQQLQPLIHLDIIITFLILGFLNTGNKEMQLNAVHSLSVICKWMIITGKWLTKKKPTSGCHNKEVKGEGMEMLP